jgi:exoribonuclease II
MTISVTEIRPGWWLAIHEESNDKGAPYGEGASELAALADFRDDIESLDRTDDREILEEIEDAIVARWIEAIGKGGD